MKRNIHLDFFIFIAVWSQIRPTSFCFRSVRNTKILLFARCHIGRNNMSRDLSIIRLLIFWQRKVYIQNDRCLFKLWRKAQMMSSNTITNYVENRRQAIKIFRCHHRNPQKWSSPNIRMNTSMNQRSCCCQPKAILNIVGGFSFTFPASLQFSGSFS